VWYPTGGFGHFINAVLTLHGENFVRPKKQLVFSKTGDSHGLDLVVPKYYKERWPAGVEFLDNKNYCVLVDNGINNEGTKFKSTFPGSTVIKICYDDFSWPVVARAMIDKVMISVHGNQFEDILPLENWDTDEPWAHREKYFLFLRDHNLRYAWRPTTNSKIYVNDLFKYKQIKDVLNSFVTVEPFEELWYKWREANTVYIDSVETAETIIKQVRLRELCDLTHINDIWTQAIVYYYIWLEFEFEVPHNDYSDWFTNTKDIVKMLIDHGVNIDSN
jgi:hypothetical protein